MGGAHLAGLKGKTDKSTTTIRAVITPRELTEQVDEGSRRCEQHCKQPGPADIDRLLHPTAGHTSLSLLSGTFAKTDDRLENRSQ